MKGLSFFLLSEPNIQAADFGIDERTVQRDIADIRAFLADFNTETGKRRTISYNREKDSYVMKIDGM